MKQPDDEICLQTVPVFVCAKKGKEAVAMTILDDGAVFRELKGVSG